jgi:hypothetical protein
MSRVLFGYFKGNGEWGMGNGEGKRKGISTRRAAESRGGRGRDWKWFVGRGLGEEGSRVGGLRPAPTEDAAARHSLPDAAATPSGCALHLATIARPLRGRRTNAKKGTARKLHGSTGLHAPAQVGPRRGRHRRRVGPLRAAPTEEAAARQTVPDPAATPLGCALGLATIACPLRGRKGGGVWERGMGGGVRERRERGKCGEELGEREKSRAPPGRSN